MVGVCLTRQTPNKPLFGIKGVFTGVLTRCMPAFLPAMLVEMAKRCRMFTLCFTRYTLKISNFCERVYEYKWNSLRVNWMVYNILWF